MKYLFCLQVIVLTFFLGMTGCAQNNSKKESIKLINRKLFESKLSDNYYFQVKIMDNKLVVWANGEERSIIRIARISDLDSNRISWDMAIDESSGRACWTNLDIYCKSGEKCVSLRLCSNSNITENCECYWRANNIIPGNGFDTDKLHIELGPNREIVTQELIKGFRSLIN